MRALTKVLAATAAAGVLLAVTPAATQGKPYVPRWQGPAQEQSGTAEQDIVGLAFLGGGAVSAGFGLYLLESSDTVTCQDARDDGPAVCSHQSGGRVELGAGLLIGGVFLAGFGIYLVASSIPDPVGLEEPLGQSSGLQLGLGVAPARAGAVVVGDVRF
jgi:hypothetical protein